MELSGNPNILVNKQGVEYGQFINKDLNAMNIKEIVELCEQKDGQKLQLLESYQSSSLRDHTYTSQTCKENRA